jgi:lactoylglutathione lyase
MGFDLGPATLILGTVAEDAGPEDRERVGRFTGVSLQVENIGAAYVERLAKGVQFTGPPEKQDWRGAVARFKEPFGNVLTLVGLENREGPP